jgi:hypothetical protein
MVLTSCINFAPAKSSQASTVEAARSLDVVFADVSGDGSDDVIVAVSLPDADALVRMAPCGDGCLDRREEVSVDDEVRQLAAADFDRDGVTDVGVVTSVDVRVYFGGAARAGRPEGLVPDDFVVAAEPEFTPWSDIVAGDFDDDGDADIGVGSSQVYDFVAGDGNRGFAPPVNVVLRPARVQGGGLATGDVDGDGDPEVLVTETGLGVSDLFSSLVAFRDGVSVAARYTERGALFSGNFGGLTAGDIDGDQINDVALVRVDPLSGTRDVRLLRAMGAGFTGFGSDGMVTSLPVRAADLELRDIDLDGKVDFLASDRDQLSWWHGLGNGSFVVRVDRAAGPGPTSLAFGNVGGSPRADLIVANATAPFAQVSYLTNASQL